MVLLQVITQSVFILHEFFVFPNSELSLNDLNCVPKYQIFLQNIIQYDNIFYVFYEIMTRQ